ncbi:MAG: tRNA (adenosine(37)-N6)-dimethylallyltransferase MiaA [Alphaproteobacteria bacterium]|nr:tRNA (adenosine(37)-N6)-dimethylallyltransferase MiaA [Alphaproteobacteria bacterium]
MNERKPQAILIAGATASGKSALAVEVAKAAGGVVLNADSMQVYRDLQVLSARPQPQEMQGIDHYLYGFVGAGDAYSVGRYVSDAALYIDTAHAQGKLPVIVGGTGLYFRGLLEGLSPVPTIEPEIRRHWRHVAENLGSAQLYTALKARDAEMAQQLVPTDSQRLVRALEVIESTGRSLSYWQKIPGKPVLDGARCIKAVVSLSRETLYERCNRRFEEMLNQGALFEVARLQAMKLDRSLPVMGALGVRPLIDYLEGECDLAEATLSGQTETRQYAKRQLTWLRRNMISWKQINLEEMERNSAISVILG